jgi:competence protein ComEC
MFHRPLIPLLLAFVGGIITGHTARDPAPSLIAVLALSIALILLLSLFTPPRSRRLSFLALFFFAGLLLDLCRYDHPGLLPLANRKEKVILEGTVLEPPGMIQETSRLLVRADRVINRGKDGAVKDRVLVTLYGEPGDFNPGDRIRFPARLRPFRNFNNPGRYDYEAAMRQKGLTCAGSVSDARLVVPMGKGSLGFPMDLLEKARRPLRERFQERLSPGNRALYSALILGERQGLRQGMREPFSRTGLGHVLAVSGLHIGLVAWLVFFVSKGLLSRSYGLTLRTDIHKLAAVLTCFPVVAYTCLAGFQVSSQRAMIMALTYLFSMIMGREKEVWSTLALAALIILAADPYALFSLSFQLSFLAVTGILWLAPALYKRIPSIIGRDRGQNAVTKRLCAYVTGLVVVTLSATVFLLPVTVFYFHRISLVAVPANLTVVPVLGLWIIPLGLLAAVSLPVFPSLTDLFLKAGEWGLEWMMTMIQFWADLPGAALWVVTPNSLEIGLFYGLIFCVFFLKRWYWARVGLVAVVALFTSDIVYWVYKTRFNPHLEVTYLDVGQGNAALVQFPGKERMLIDGGGFSGGAFDVGKMVVAPFLLHSKIRGVDYLVLSHAQSDHMNGLRFIAAHFAPREFWYNGVGVKTQSFQELMRILQERNTRKLLPRDLAGGRNISGTRIELLHPPPGTGRSRSSSAGKSLNDSSMVLKLSYGGKSCLFPGDLEREGERRVVLNGGSRLRSDVLLAPHHGGKTSCSQSFLERVKPRACVISSGGGNPFGFPHAETVQRLQAAGSRVLRIDEVGAVRVSLGPQHFQIRGYKDP